MKKLDKNQILDELYKNRKKIRKLKVKKLILFGSYARNEQTKNSDIDFLVEFEKDNYTIDNHLNLLYLLEDLFNKKIDLVKTKLIRNELKEHILGGIKYDAKI